jgi:Ca2+-binding RTX toxin-like protein
MDDRLSLGIPDRTALDAPSRRFRLLDEQTKVSSTVPAILLASWGLLLKQMFGSDKEEASHQPQPALQSLDGPERETEAAVAPSTTGPAAGSSELVRAFGLASVSMNEAFTAAVGLDSLSFARTESPRLSLVPANQNAPAVPRPQTSAGETKPAGGVGGGGGGGSDGSRTGGSDPHKTDDRSKLTDKVEKPPVAKGSQDSPIDRSKPPGDVGTSPPAKTPPDPPKSANRSPVINGAVELGSGLVNESIIISLSQLLTGARDPDGDTLSVQALHVDQGSLQVLGPDQWLYTPEHDETGAVRFTYNITDGSASIAQTAHADLHAAPEDEIHGTDGDDFLIGTPRADVIDAGAGNDIVYGRASNDTIYGGEGNDRLVGGEGDDIIFGGPGNDVVFGGAGNDTLFGEAGDDVLYGEDGNDLILGGDGDDFASGGRGNDTILGGDGNDTLQGDEGNDTIDGEKGDDHIDGGAGDDRLIGGSGNDCIAGGTGNDTVAGGDGNDRIDGGAGDDTLSGEAGDDVIHGGDGDDVIAGGDGNDCIDGGAGNDTILGGVGDDHIEGGDGNDVISGGPGNDVIDAGSGDDVVVLSADRGYDVISGGLGSDTLDLSQIVFDVNVDLPEGIVEIANGKTAHIFEIENLYGGSGRDRLVADAHVNIMEGGDGNDTFVFNDLAALKNDGGPRDRIVDFGVGDRLDLSRVGQEFDDFSGRKLFFAGADQSRFDDVGAVGYRHEIVSEQEITVVTGHLDSNPDHDFEIVLNGSQDLDAGNFVLTLGQQPAYAHHGT